MGIGKYEKYRRNRRRASKGDDLWGIDVLAVVLVAAIAILVHVLLK